MPKNASMSAPDAPILTISGRAEPILDYVKRRLQESRGDWPQISIETGVPYFTITNVAQGKSEDPRISTIQKLFDYFQARDALSAA